MNKLFALVLFLGFSVFSTAQDLEPVTWSFESEAQENGQYLLTFKAEIKKGWYLYSQHLDEGGPIPTSFHFEESNEYELDKEVSENGPFVEGFDDMFGMNIRKYKELAEFKVLVKDLKEGAAIKGYLEFMTCDDNKCLPPAEVEFAFNFSD